MKMVLGFLACLSVSPALASQIQNPSQGAFSAGSAPECLGTNSPIAVNDAQVEAWEDTTQNQYRARGHIQGKLTEVFHDRTGHKHFSVQIGATTEDAIEIVYNESFGALPALQTGMNVEACGDYITVGSSPDHAILHWVHKSDTSSHPSGYVMIEGKVYGQEAGTGN